MRTNNNNMLNVQRYLSEYSVSQLKSEYFIKVAEYSDLMSLNYSQIESPKNNPITNECRGLILEKNPPYKIICRSFDRFYNYGENDSFPDNFQDYKCFEKRDGSLINVYNYNSNWVAATRKMIYAEGINLQGYNFSDLFFSCFNKSSLNFVDPNFTLIFELTSPNNRIVTNYKKTDYRLLTVRNRFTGKELNYDQLVKFSKEYNFPLANEYYFKNYDDVVNSYNTLNELEEGYVFINYDTMHRFKMKNPSYLAAAHIRCNGSISPKNIINLIFLNDYEEYLLMFPEDIIHFEKYIEAYNKMIIDVMELYNKYKFIENRKEFALTIKNEKCKNLLFGLRNNKVLTDLFSNLTNNSKVSLINNYL